jgi:predicted nucleic acid-binding protein
VVAEARYGALRADWSDRRVADLERLLRSAFVLMPDDRTATAFARLRLACEHAGHPLHQKVHTGDLWIAATAVRRGLTLVSDDAVFDDCPELRVTREQS